jgi:hypothetical protein
MALDVFLAHFVASIHPGVSLREILRESGRLLPTENAEISCDFSPFGCTHAIQRGLKISHTHVA